MRRKQLLEPGESAWEAMDLTAMIDVLFILLVFLMLSLGGVLISVPLNLPQVQPGGASQVAKGQLILLERQGSLFYQGQRFPHLQALQQAMPAPLSGAWKLAAEDQAPAGKLVELLQWLNRQGVTQLEILAQERP